MRALRSVLMAFSMFSRLPVPRTAWEPDNMTYMLAAFPLIGCAIGLLLWGWLWVCGALSIGTALSAAGMTLLPVAVTGGVHLDGFCDTMDALASHAEPQRARAILKDPHAGAFAVIGVCAYFLLYFALCTELAPQRRFLCCFLPVLSRAVSGFAGVCFPVADKGLLHDFSASADKRTSLGILIAWFVIGAAAMLCFDALAGAAAAIAAAACCAIVYRMSGRRFGGMSGDLAGYLLQTAELSMLACVVLFGKAGLVCCS